MKQLRWAVAAIAALILPLLAGAAPAGANAYVLGDSIGEGVAAVSGLKGLARISIHIRGPKALAQIAQTPPGSTVFIFLGTNDAEGSIKNIEKSVGDIVAAGERKQLTMYWIGPHCVRHSWDSRAKELDAVLQGRLAKTSVRYVSMRDTRLCSMLEPDGVHPTTAGSRYMWEKARREAGFVPNVVAARASPESAGAAADGLDSATETTGAIPAAPKVTPRPEKRAAQSAGTHPMVIEVHRVPAAPSAPILWVRE